MTPSRCSLAVARAAACLAVLSGVGALVLVSALSPPVAYGVGSVTTTTTLGGCVLVPVGVACGVGAGGSSSTTTPVSTTTPSQPVPSTTGSSYAYQVTPEPEEIDGENYVCNPNGQLVPYSTNVPSPPYPLWDEWTPASGLPAGFSVPYLLQETNTQTQVQTSLGIQCSAQPPATTTLPPPTPEESWAAALALLPLAEIKFSPSDNGLVHLETWFWLSNDAAGVPVTVTATTDTGQTITAVVQPVGYSWTFGPPGASGPSDTAGSEMYPATTYTYVDAGTYEVSVTVEWAGKYYGPGGVLLGELGPVAAPATYAPYEVREIRSVLTAGTG